VIQRLSTAPLPLGQNQHQGSIRFCASFGAVLVEAVRLLLNV
jgi:hypothetical protein